MKCSFCGNEIERGRGILFVRKDGNLIYFDSGKCQTNMLDLGRKASKLKWARGGAIGRPTTKTEKKMKEEPAKKAETKQATKKVESKTEQKAEKPKK